MAKHKHRKTLIKNKYLEKRSIVINISIIIEIYSVARGQII